MWKQMLDWLLQVLRQNDETQRNRTEIKELRKEIDDLADTVKLVVSAMQRLEEREQHEREKLEMRFRHEREMLELQRENERLRAERNLLPAKKEEIKERSDS